MLVFCPFRMVRAKHETFFRLCLEFNADPASCTNMVRPYSFSVHPLGRQAFLENNPLIVMATVFIQDRPARYAISFNPRWYKL